MKSLKFVIGCLSILILSGCGSTSLVKQADSQTAKALAAPQIRYVVVRPQASLLEDCVVSTTPPNKTRYLSSTAIEREIALAAYSRSLQADLAICAGKPASLREFFDQQEKLYGEKK